MSRSHCLVAPLLTAALLTAADPARAEAQGHPPDLALASLEDLMKLDITSASRKEQRAEAVPAPVFVITQDDIRRSGMTTVAELLRLVPGMQVAEINANKWAVSARGFNGLFSNKLLVLVDGRSIYDPLNSGQFLESEDLLLEDIDRIEVVRGPAGAIWGANAVNGVINILTKTAESTLGASAQLSAGTLETVAGSARYGGVIGATTYRVFAKWADHGDTRLSGGDAAGDAWRAAAGGFRADWQGGRRTAMLEANASAADLDALWIDFAKVTPGARIPTTGRSHTQIANVLGLWTQAGANDSLLQVQAFFDSRPRREAAANSSQITTEGGLQYHAKLGARHDVVVGAGARLTHEVLEGTFTLSVTPFDSHRLVLNTFAQDEIGLAGNRVHVTLGARLERDTYVGWGIQPTARVLVDLPMKQRIWAGVSRALRTPSLFDRGIRVNVGPFSGADGVPLLFSVLGNPEFRSERVITAEAGYRVNVGTRASFDVTAFSSHYYDLQTVEPLTPAFELQPAPAHLLIASEYANMLTAQTSGLEFVGHWQPLPVWRVDGSYTGFAFTPRTDPASRDAAAAASDGNAPRHQWQIRSSVTAGPRVDLDGAFYRVGALGEAAVAGYTRADARVAVKLTRSLSVALIGQNLFTDTHAEFGGSDLVIVPTAIPRSGRVQLTWRH